MQWVLLAVVVVGFGVLAGRLWLDRVRLAPVRRVVRAEPVTYRTPISAHWSRGWWGRGNARGMELVVHERSFELSYSFPGGRFLSTEWYCRGRDAEMALGSGKFLLPVINRTCIVLSIPAIDHPVRRQEILLAPQPGAYDLQAAWQALLRCGVRSSGDAPEFGV